MSVRSDSDFNLQRSVQNEFAWIPDVNATGIGVAVADGTITLSGEVDSAAERLAATRAALRVRGVRAVIDHLTVHPKSSWPVTETDIAKRVARALHAASNVPDTVKAEINIHDVTLSGTVDGEYQRRAAVHAVQQLRDVSSVTDQMTLTTRPSAGAAKQRINGAIARNALLDPASPSQSSAPLTVALGDEGSPGAGPPGQGHQDGAERSWRPARLPDA